MMKSRPLILQRLRTETMYSHKQIENEDIMLRLSQAKISLAEYTNILALWHRMYRAVFAHTESFIKADTAPIDWLEKDLTQLGRYVTPEHEIPDSDKPDHEIPYTKIPMQITSYAEAVGYLYVFYGSQLGNQVIFQRLCQSNACANWPKTYFYGRGKNTSTAWSQFGQQLATQHFSSQEIDTAVTAACSAFELVRQQSISLLSHD